MRKSSGMKSSVYHRTAQFAESDAAGVIHFSWYARYVEEAEHYALAQIGYPLQLTEPGGFLWPRLDFSAHYARALLPMEAFRVELSLVRAGRSSLTWGWTIKREGEEEKLAYGEMKTVCCVARKGKMESIELPPELRRKLNELS